MKKILFLSVVVIVLFVGVLPVSADTCGLGYQTGPQSVIFGEVYRYGFPAPAGTVIEAVNSRGQTVACYLISQQYEVGFFGPLAVFQEETGRLGAFPGEEIHFLVNGLEAESDQPFYWQPDYQDHFINLTSPKTSSYLKAVVACDQDCGGAIRVQAFNINQPVWMTFSGGGFYEIPVMYDGSGNNTTSATFCNWVTSIRGTPRTVDLQGGTVYYFSLWGGSYEQGPLIKMATVRVKTPWKCFSVNLPVILKPVLPLPVKH